MTATPNRWRVYQHTPLMRPNHSGLARRLRSIAQQRGIDLAFNQEPNGLWAARLLDDEQTLVWLGNLSDMNKLAKGRALHV